ncbi:tetratricopeptide repeat protein [uncultured Megasphaera sp.]|uniref:tetratricopeptide repeat protein n=1 Tax=uncultured Megasphaera sp. TaxID=165188 RepID=UPI0025941106|nr:tetratricopeptide repeat protein [uncultured Megasphaera sp.]
MVKPIQLFSALVCCCLFLGGCGPASQPAATEKEAPPAVAAPAAPPAINADSEMLFQQGLAAYNQFHYDQAIALYDKALAADSKNYKALSGKGIALAMQGNGSNDNEVKQGIACVRQALQIAPEYVPAYYDLALALKIDKQYDEAIAWFQKVIAKEPDNTWSYYGIATIYGDQGKAKEAVSYLKQAVALDPENVRQAAQNQSHFDKIRSDPEFKKLISQ